MKVLLSIKPEFAEKIFSGEKRYEFRKAIFKNQAVTTVVVYATLPVGKVVGEFEIESVLHDSPRSLWGRTKSFAGISRAYFDAYFRARSTAYAIQVKNPQRYSAPRDLAEISQSPPPQSFMYLN